MFIANNLYKNKGIQICALVFMFKKFYKFILKESNRSNT